MKITAGNSWPINFRLTLIMPAKFITICRAALKKLYIQEDVLRLAQIYSPLNYRHFQKVKNRMQRY